MSFVQGQGDEKVVGAQTSSQKDLGTDVTPTTVSGDAPTTQSIRAKCLLGLH